MKYSLFIKIYTTARPKLKNPRSSDKHLGFWVPISSTSVSQQSTDVAVLFKGFILV